MTLFGNGVIADVISEDEVIVDSYGPLIHMTDVHMRRGKKHRQREGESLSGGQTAPDHGDRGRSDAFTTKEAKD